MTPAVTTQRPCWVNTDSPESGTTGNDTSEEKTQMSVQTHTHTTHKNIQTHTHTGNSQGSAAL